MKSIKNQSIHEKCKTKENIQQNFRLNYTCFKIEQIVSKCYKDYYYFIIIIYFK